MALHHWEAYLFTMGQSTGRNSGLGPAMEANYGPFADAQLQFQIPMAYAQGDDGRRHSGFGDVQVGFKYRFVHEGDFQMALYPQVQAPTGRSADDLGSGHWRILLPLWLQESFGPWTTYGGGGYMRNPGPGNRDYSILGWQVQRELGEGASLGFELFRQGSPADGEPASTSWNIGFEAPLVEHFQLVGSGGRIFKGEVGTQFYLGIRANI